MKSFMAPATATGAIAVAILMPIFFDPFRGGNIEYQRAVLFRSIVIGLLAFIAMSQTTRFVRVLWSGRSNSVQLLPMTNARLSLSWSAAPVVLALSLLISTRYSLDATVSLWGPGDGHGVVTSLALIIFFLIVGHGLQTWHHVESVITALLIGSIGICLYALIQYFGLDPLLWTNDATASDIQSTLGQSLFLGAYLALVSPFALSRSVQPKRSVLKLEWRYVVVFLLQTGCLLLTLSRSALLALMIGSLTFLWLMNPPIRRSFQFVILTMMLICGLLLFIFIYFYGLALFPRHVLANSVDLANVRATSNQIRLWIWGDILNLVPHAWLFGYGPETFDIVFCSGVTAHFDANTCSIARGDPHNIVLYHLFSLGVFGLLAFTVIVVGFYKKSLDAIHSLGVDSRRSTVAAIVGSATAYLMQAQFQPDMIGSYSLFWLVLALGLVTSKLAGMQYGQSDPP